MKRIGTLCLAALLLISGMMGKVFPAAQAESAKTTQSYYYYLQSYQDALRPEWEVAADLASFSTRIPGSVTAYQQLEGSESGLYITEDCEDMTVQVQVPQTGLYNIELTYFPFTTSDMQIMFGLLIDGQLPFTEANGCIINRIYQNEPIEQDAEGNDIRPRANQLSEWQTQFLSDQTGIYGDLAFYLEEGLHELTFCFEETDMLLEHVTLKQQSYLPTYQDYISLHRQQGAKDVQDVQLIIQAESYYRQSSSTLWPDIDRTNPLTQPFDYLLNRINFGGGSQWKYPGQSISWLIDVPEDGLYNLGIKYRQSYLDGLFSSRQISIDGQVPFEEFNSVRFNYTTQWNNALLGNDYCTYSIYLTKGQHVLTMKNVLGDLNNTMSVLQTCINNLNDLYLSIVMITSSEPDKYRDYYLDKLLPDLAGNLRENAALLFEESRRLVDVVGGKGRETAYFEDIAYNLESYADNIGDLTYRNRLEDFKNDISSLSAKMITYQEQALDIDYFVLCAPGEEMPRSQPSFGESVQFQVNSFAASFTEEAKADENATVRIWTSGGNKQYEVIQQMVDDLFTPQTGIHVELELVSSVNLIQAVVAGEGPDIQLGVGGDSVVNLALRGALMELNDFPGYDELLSEYLPGCDIPFTLESRVYGIPNTGSYGMMFIRTDVFDQLGLKIPTTWDEIYDIAQVVQRNNMSLGVVPSFATLLYQKGGSYYNEELTQVLFDEDISVAAFKQQTEFYTKYDFPLTYDFVSRFRTGEMPIAIADYSTYNTLKYSAPEISGLWEMYPIPGTVCEDGTVNYTQAAGGVMGVVMLRTAQNKDDAWEFMRWWSSAEAQERYGKDMEAAMGVAARYNTLNMQVFPELGWTKKELAVLKEGMANLRFIPIVPGDYYVTRGVNNTFLSVVNDGENVREKLTEWTVKINEELVRKRNEFYANNEGIGGDGQ